MSKNERDTHFFNFAKLLVADLEKQGFLTPIRGVRPYTLIARRAYDLIQSGCIAINTAQMQQGARLHPHAMLRAVQDLTQWPESSTDSPS